MCDAKEDCEKEDGHAGLLIVYLATRSLCSLPLMGMTQGEPACKVGSGLKHGTLNLESRNLKDNSIAWKKS